MRFVVACDVPCAWLSSLLPHATISGPFESGALPLSSSIEMGKLPVGAQLPANLTICTHAHTRDIAQCAKSTLHYIICIYMLYNGCPHKICSNSPSTNRKKKGFRKWLLFSLFIFPADCYPIAHFCTMLMALLWTVITTSGWCHFTVWGVKSCVEIVIKSTGSYNFEITFGIYCDVMNTDNELVPKYWLLLNSMALN